MSGTTTAKPKSTTRDDLDAYIDGFEVARANDRAANLAEHTPPRDHDHYADVVAELIRVDMEYGWRDGSRPRVESYQGRFGDVLAAGHLADVAFEEYRLRSAAGEVVSAEEYHRRLGVDTSSWPCLSVALAATPCSGDLARHRLDSAGSSHSAGAASSASAFPIAGGNFAGFDLVAELGRGAFARVYLARQPMLAERPVVLKISTPFSAEPQRLAQLQHSNIVPIYSVHEVNGLRAVCMPYFGRTTLADLLIDVAASGRWPMSGRELISTLAARDASTQILSDSLETSDAPSAQEPFRREGVPIDEGLSRAANSTELVVRIALQIADALAHAHQRGVVHRDLKPANVLVTDDGRPMLLDFNLAADTSVSVDRAAIGGTLVYMPPEQLAALANRESVVPNPGGDLFAMGVVLFEMLTGGHPYPLRQGASRDVLAQMAADRQSPPQSQFAAKCATIPSDLRAIVGKCLAPNPSERYASACDLRDDLQRFLEYRPLAHAPDRDWRRRLTKWSRRHPRLASGATVATIALLLVAAMATAWWQRGLSLARYDAQESLNQFQQRMAELRIPLSTHGLDEVSRKAADAAARDALAEYGVFDDDRWRARPVVRHLPEDQRIELSRELGETLYLLAAAQIDGARRTNDATGRQTAISSASQYNERAWSCYADLAPSQALARQRDQIRALLGDASAKSKSDAVNPPSDDPREHYAAGLQLLSENRPQDAARMLGEAAAMLPHDFAIRYALGQAQLLSRRFDAAEEQFTACAALSPTAYLAFFYRGLCRLELKKLAAAEDDFDKVLDLRPTLPAALVNRAVVRQRRGERRAAMDDLTAALEAGATQTRIYFLRGRIRSQLGDEAGAKADYDEGIRRTPDDAESWFARGLARMTDDPKAALADLETAVRVDPASRMAWQNLAQLHAEKLGQNEQALAALDRALEIDAHYAAALAGRAVIHARLGKRDAAHRDAAAALAETRDGDTVYRAACAFALTAKQTESDARRALMLLAEALLVEPRYEKLAATDADLAAIRSRTEFTRLLAAAKLLRKCAAIEREL